MPKVRARFIVIQMTCRMREAIQVELRRRNDMFYLGVKVDPSTMFLPTEQFPLGARKIDVLITCYELNAKYERT